MIKNKIIINDDVLSSQRNFNDHIIGILLISSRFASLSKIAKLTDFKERRISQASERLQKAGILKKIHNLILVDDIGDTLPKIEKFRLTLLREHGIRTPKPIYYRKQWRAALFWANTYCIVADRQKDGQLTQEVNPNFFLTPLAIINNSMLWQFKSQIGFDTYLDNHGYANL
jgi:hypothetical protein